MQVILVFSTFECKLMKQIKAHHKICKLTDYVKGNCYLFSVSLHICLCQKVIKFVQFWGITLMQES